MPIYAYRCDTCGFAKDVLQKVSDPLLTECPSCSKSTFKKQLTAAGFQLKGTGWYVTDFRNGAGKAASAAPAAVPENSATKAPASDGSSGKTDAAAAAPAAGSSTDTSSTA
jgi:putative FmdB family regulatory protein